MAENKKQESQCEMCAYFDFDEEYDDYLCMIGMDEDEAVRLAGDRHSSCPYFRFYDEYKIVQKQN